MWTHYKKHNKLVIKLNIKKLYIANIYKQEMGVFKLKFLSHYYQQISIIYKKYIAIKQSI